MLMQPQSPNPNFDFMLNDQPKARRSLPLPDFSRPVRIILGVVLAIIVLIVLSSLFSSGSKVDSKPYMDILARGQETLRITSYVQTLQLQDPQAQAAAATVSSALASDKQQIIDYLQKNHIKVDSKALAIDADKTTDTSMQTASQNNNLDSVYTNYLRDSLNRYENDIRAAYPNAGPNGKAILNDASISTTTLLTSPPLK